MFVPLHRERRRTLARASILTCTAALLLAPFCAPLEFAAEAGDEARLLRPADPAIPQEEPAAKLPVARDPFVPDAAAVTPGGVRVAGTGGADGDDPGIVLPPNEGAIVVEAIALGAAPRALLEIAGRSRIVRPGENIDGTAVTAIDSQGVHLQSGEILALPARSQ